MVELRARILDEPLRLAETAAEALLKDCDERLRLLDDAKMRPRDRLAELERLPA